MMERTLEEKEPPSFTEGILKFTDCLIASTSAQNSAIFVWEPATMAPLETLKSDNFFVASNTLNVQRDGHIFGSHI